jgi:predicted SprT family Zn-dependent metalloprotease
VEQIGEESMMTNEKMKKKIEEIFDSVSREHFNGELKQPVFRLTKRMKRGAGQVDLAKWEMAISVPYHDRYGWHAELENTVKHEMIHLFLGQTGNPAGHNRLFKKIAMQINAPFYCKNMPKRPYRYLFECPSCKREYKTRKWMGKKYSCGECSGGRFDRKYMLSFKETLV